MLLLDRSSGVTSFNRPRKKRGEILEGEGMRVSPLVFIQNLGCRKLDNMFLSTISFGFVIQFVLSVLY